MYQELQKYPAHLDIHTARSGSSSLQLAFASTQWEGAPNKADKDLSPATTFLLSASTPANKQLLGFRAG